MSSQHPVYLDEANIPKYLSWDTLIPAIENVISDMSHKDETQTIQPARLIMPISNVESEMLCMPSFSGRRKILGCKVTATFLENKHKGLPVTFGTILLLNHETGKLKMILEAAHITAWRTAAASVVATKYLHKGKKNILAILGAGAQGRSHALALQHYFNFSEVRIWNRTYEKAEQLCSELGSWAKPFKSNDLCVKEADVIVTATFSPNPVLKGDWLKSGTHINAIGFGDTHHDELSMDLYQRGTLVVDNMAGAVHELSRLIEKGVPICCELGEVIQGSKTLPANDFTIFQSMGMSLEDVISAELVYKKYEEDSSK